MRINNTKEKITQLLYHACQRGEANNIQNVETLLNTLSQHYHDTAGNKHILDEVINTVSPGGNTMLIVASEAGHKDIVQLLMNTLLQVNADVATTLLHQNRDGKCAMDLAVMKGNTEIMRNLIDAYIRALSITERNNYLITSCNDGSSANVMQILKTLDTREKIESAMHYRDPDGNTALIHAVENGHTEVVKLLIDAYQNANIDMVTAINQQNIDGDTALICAVDNSNENIVTLLLNALQNRNIDIVTAINQKNNDGDTALIYATRSNPINMRIIRKLLNTLQNANANIIDTINHINGAGANALMLAAARLDTEVVKLLLIHGGTCEDEILNHLITTILYFDNKQKIPKDRLEAIIQDGDMAWVSRDYTNFNNRNRKEKNTLHALACWGVIIGNHTFVDNMISVIGGGLTPAEHTEYLRLALHAQRFPIVQTLLDHIDESGSSQACNRQSILNYLLHLMAIEQGPLPSIEFLLAHGATPKTYVLNGENARTELTLLTQHTVLQVQKVCNHNPAHKKEAKQNLLRRFKSIMAQREIVSPEGITPQAIALRMGYYRRQLTLFHHLSYENKFPVIRAIKAHMPALNEQNRYEEKPAKRMRK